MRNLRFFALLIFMDCWWANADVDQRSGTMNFSQDLAVVKSGSIQLPLVLSYSSGIRINDRASWSGLGFNLNLPYIERFPNGSVDEKPGVFTCPGSQGYYSDKTYGELIKDIGNGYVVPDPLRELFQREIVQMNKTYMWFAECLMVELYSGIQVYQLSNYQHTL